MTSFATARQRLRGWAAGRPVRQSLLLVLVLALAPVALLGLAQGIALAGLRDASWWMARADLLFPLAVAVFAIAGIWLGAQGIILRWIDESRRLASACATGDWAASLSGFERAPREFRDLAASLGRMAQATQRRDRALTAALDRQRALSLELHHRVRNNLQMLSSYLALAERNSRSPEGAAALAAARLRVAAVALMHRLLYDREELATLPAAELLAELCLLIEQHGAGSLRFEGAAGADDPALDIDTAVPLALWVIEAVDALGGPAAGVSMDLCADEPSCLRIRVRPLSPGGAPPPESAPLLRAIARQLGAEAPDRSAGSELSIGLGIDRADEKNHRFGGTTGTLIHFHPVNSVKEIKKCLVGLRRSW